jgi:hypothetical protein
MPDYYRSAAGKQRVAEDRNAIGYVPGEPR